MRTEEITDPVGGQLDAAPGFAPMLVRIGVPFGGAVVWALHLAAIYVAVELLCRDGRAEDQLLGFRTDIVVVSILTVLAAVPTALLVGIVHGGRIAASGGASESLPTFARSFSVGLNLLMLFAIVLEGIVVLLVGPCR